MKLLFNSIFLYFCVIALSVQASCFGRFINPVTDICWSCLFPITVGNTTIGEGEDTSNPSGATCKCPDGLFPRFGISLGFWEPVRLVDVTRTPYCFVSLGGLQLAESSQMGTQKPNLGQARKSAYHIHVYHVPILDWLDMGFDDCLESDVASLLYASELDPTWLNDELSFVFNPEAVAVGNPVSQAACATDCTAASASFPLDDLYWCAGCQGSMFPVTGHVSNHVSNVQASLLIAQRGAFRMHRQGNNMPGTMGEAAMCGYYDMPTMQKSQYKTQMTYPYVPSDGSTYACNPLGRSSVLWESLVSYPFEGEDFAYLLWRKRNCCAS